MWIDALTPKQLLLAYGLERAFVDKGFRTIVTARRFPGITELLDRLGFRPIVIGEYGKNMREKLEKELERSTALLRQREILEAQTLVSYPSPSAVRVAFGLAMKIIIMTDTPHAIHAHRLTLPLADAVVHSSFIEGSELDRFVLKEFTERLTFDGVDELAWINTIKPDDSVADKLGLPREGYAIVRPPERYAAYYGRFGGRIDFKTVVQMLAREVPVVLIPRYEDDKKLYSGINNVSIVEGVLTLDLLPHSLLVVTGGATMAREAALLGVPSIYTFHTEMSVNKRLRELGFPLFHKNKPNEILETSLRILREKKRYKVDNLREKLEDPREHIVVLVEKLLQKSDSIGQ